MKGDKVVLIIGSVEDKVIQFFAKQLKYQEQKAFCFIDQSLFGSEIHMSHHQWNLASGRVIYHHQVVGVWNRLVNLSRETDLLPRTLEQYACYLMDEVYANVLNQPKHGMSNHSKQYQVDCVTTKRIKKVESYICANSELDWSLRRQVLIRKSLSGIRSVVCLMTPQEKKLRIEAPELFQPFIEGINIRVHVVGKKVIACCCESESVDYRYTNRVKMYRFDLPDWLEKECVSISQQLQLPFSGIDLIKKKQSYYLLEVNPAPGYAYFDIDGNISRALCEYYMALI